MKKYFYLLVCVFIAFSFDAAAQKKKKNRNIDAPPDFKETLSEDDMMQAEYYFIEAEKHFILDQYAEALELFKESLKYNSNSGATHYKIGQSYFALDQPQEALVYAIKAKEIDPKNKYYYIITADILTGMSDFGQAAATYEEMMTNIPDTDTYLYELAALYLYQNELEKALSTYERAKDRFGVMEEVAYQKQQIYLKLGRTEDAIGEIKQLISAFPLESAYIIDLAKLYISNNQYSEVITTLEGLLSIDPSNAEASVMLSEAYRKTGNREKAMESLKIAFENPSLNFQAKLQLLGGYIAQLPDAQIENLALELSEKITAAHPDESRGFAIAGDLHYQLGNKSQATDNYRKALVLDNSNFSLWQNAIQLEMELGQYDSAIVHSEQALEYFPNQAVLYYWNGTANLITKNFKKAIRSFDEGKKYSSANPDLESTFYGQLGDAYNGLGDNENSDAAYDAALRVKEDNDHVLNNYSYYLSLRKENLEKALEMSAILVEKHPKNATYLDTHAWVLYVLERYKEAHDYLERAVLDDQASGTIYEHYGDVLYQLNEKDKAVEQWEKARLKGSTTDLIDKKIADRKLYE